ncbi:MAG: nickel pincer cofactor biosynthesis protein LarC [Lachnospiraceae bacterium]|nr:nickel pincer cofactor biosynthesis protein LarC [Lachnospiraceae bacterium]
MGKSLYLECNAGISGDMTVGALLDLGADEAVLRKALESLPIEGFDIDISRVKKAGIDCCDFKVILAAEYENHDHDMEYLHGHEHHHEHRSEHGHDHAHHHDHRGINEIRSIIASAGLTGRAKELAVRIFEILAEAEAEAHGVSVEEVHFHEIGAVDSIVDIVAAAVCIDNLNITEVIVPKLCEGTGTVRCQHGILSIPVPATANILAKYNIPLEIMDIKGEFVTPTGAAIAAAIMTSDRPPKNFRIKQLGLGAGKREYERAGILRAMIIDYDHEEQDTVYKLESNIDDCTGEQLGFVLDRLFAAGARDVHYIPVYMKKNRPAWQLTVICKKEDIETLESIIFRETTTIGIRRVEMERTVLKREQITLQTAFGSAEVKVCTVDGERRYYPEYDSVAKICHEQKASYNEVYQMLVRQCIDSAV